MGHRANFVLIEDGKARAFEDQWAALGCTLSLEVGAKKLKRDLPKVYAATEELMDWAFAEAGILIDYDERLCIAFGYPEIDLSELPEEHAADVRAVMEAFEAGWPTFVSYIAKGWAGFTLVWDARGVDAFALHLARRKITSIKTQPASHPESTAKEKPVVVVVTADDGKKATKSAPKNAAKPAPKSKESPGPRAKKAASTKSAARSTKAKPKATEKPAPPAKKAATKKASAPAKKAAAKKTATKKAATKKAATKKAATKKAR